jgi:hypothetical protein
MQRSEKGVIVTIENPPEQRKNQQNQKNSFAEDEYKSEIIPGDKMIHRMLG